MSNPHVFAPAIIAMVFGAAMILPGAFVHADTVDDLVTFSAGTTARADEVNGNFSEVANAVNGNDGLIAGLRAEVDELRESVETPGARFGRTLFVPADDADPAANCEMLRATLAQATGVAADPVRLELGRGTYDCGSAPLTMKNFVTIEGAGRDASTIIGNPSDPEEGVVNGTDDAILRSLTVQHRADGSGAAIAISTGGARMSVIDVAIKVESDSASVFGVLASGGSL
ncbi:MAG TPA: hypothetical protein VE175_04885, partial [Woeseiaceae bacterium]|nr:hypothetical protein [Woeseiaceae bacterium]